jgi:N-acetyl sugar amidotransferase
MKIYNEEELKKDPKANFGRPYQQCSISVMDTIADPDITFDKKGICNYYYEYLAAEKQNILKGEPGEKRYKEIITQIKADGQGKKYDCILGVSGGVDSSYLAYIAKQAGLRVLCVHFDNAWNSELAVRNIQNIVEKCGFDLYTYVIDWEEFRDIQLSYFKANVIDIEAVTDIAISNIVNRIAAEKKIKHVLSGDNVVTEYTLPKAWTYKNSSNLMAIQKEYGTLKLKKYPLIHPILRRIYARTTKFEVWKPLNLIAYDKKEVKKIISKELNWIDYGGKHYESVFTRFYQGYILPAKFKVDKRKAHLSNLIFSGQLSKSEAIEDLKNEMYPYELFQKDLDFVLKKLNFTTESFETYLTEPIVKHEKFGSSLNLIDELKLYYYVFR